MDEKQLEYLIENDKESGINVDIESSILSRIKEKETKNEFFLHDSTLMKLTVVFLILLSSIMGIVTVNPESEKMKDQNLFVNEMHFETVENSILNE